MSKIVEFSLPISHGNVTYNNQQWLSINDYCYANGDVKLSRGSTANDSDLVGSNKVAYELYNAGDWGSQDGSVYLNDRAKAILYPTSTCHPFKIDVNYRATRYSTAAYQRFFLGGQEMWYSEISTTRPTNYSNSGIINNTITNSTRNSEIRWDIHSNSGWSAVSVVHFTIKTYFIQYEHKAFKSNDARGVNGVAVSSATPYQGDPVTYTVQLHNKSVWKGWYADPEHTILVSTNQEYTVEANSDYTLYAYAVQLQGVSYKINGEWKEGIVIWQRQNGYWVEITKDDIPKDVGYEIRESQQNE